MKLSYNGKIIGDAKLSLLDDINMSFNQNQWMLTLEGGAINKLNAGSINDNTYVVIDCEVMTKEEIMMLDNEVQKILKKHKDDNGWLYSYDVYNELIKSESYKNLEYYNLWKLLDNGNIENRYIDGKDRDIGCLRLKKT